VKLLLVLLLLILAYYTHVPAFTASYTEFISHIPDPVLEPAACLIITTPEPPAAEVTAPEGG
jgi:hypothetical protein